MSLLSSKNICSKCKVRLPKNRPKISCWHCGISKHYRCQGLSKADTHNILATSDYDWICSECIKDNLPVNACNASKGHSIEIKCQSCEHMCYSKASVQTCHWCENISHKKCIIGELGCLNCCEKNIAGFNAQCYEILGELPNNSNCTYNPYSVHHDTNLIGDQIQREEETNTLWNEISESLISCRYMQPNHVQPSCVDELNILSLNIRSLIKSIGTVRDNIGDYEKHDVICFNETNCNVDNLPNGLDDLNLDGFHPPITQNPIRTSNKGGGLAIYVNRRVCQYEDIETIKLDQNFPSPDGEFLFLKIKNCKSSNNTVIVGNVYRSPNRKHDKFNDLLELALCQLDRHSRKQVLLVGDYNTDLIKYETDSHSQALIDTTSNRGFIQVISKPTRITDHSATLIDHIYTNKIENLVQTSVLTVDISDHLATFAKVKINTNGNNSNCKDARPPSARADEGRPDRRIFKAANDEKFSELINNETWQVPPELDAEEQFKHFSETYTKHYNTAYPLVTDHIRRKNERLNSKPWILPWLEDACARKNDLHEKYVNNSTPEKKMAYEKMKKFTEKHVQLAKDKYHKAYFDKYKDNSKKQWEMINRLLNRNKKKFEKIKLKGSNGQLITSSSAVAGKFNDYFSNIADNLKQKGDNTNSHYDDDFAGNMAPAVENSIYLQPAEAGEVHSIIKGLKNKATLDTKVHALKLANMNLDFTTAFAKTITSSLEQGIFPQALKLARVVPIHKSDSKTDVSNYRPISLLSTFSKIYEKIMHERVTKFLETNRSLHEHQYGFRSGRSCEHALLTAQNTLTKALSKKQVSLLLLIDFSKAFDMVDHPILLKKLYRYGIRGTAYQWFKSYLQNREQFVSVNGVDSDKAKIKYGVPQGSILGPLLFIIYINDLPNIYNLAKFILYADDANIIVSGNTLQEIESQIMELAPLLIHWVTTNGLKLNLKKTNYMIISNNRNDRIRDVYIGGKKIERVHDAKFLGVIMDDKLSWSKHIQTVRVKMSRYVGIMYRIKSLLPLNARIQIFHSLVQSHINYCSLIWGFANRANINSLFMGQKKGLRAALPGYVNYFYKDGNVPTHTKESFGDLKILTIHSLIATNALTFMHKVYNFPQSLPSSVRDTISINAPKIGEIDNHSDYDKWQKEFGAPCYSKTIFYKGPLLYSDDKYSHVISPASLLSFKVYRNRIKNILLIAQTEGDEIEWQFSNFALNNIAGIRRSKRNH